MPSKTCPNCKGLTELDGKSCSCGWRETYARTNQPRLCAFNDHGESCHKPGHLSTDTHGGGPWYCRTHFARIMGWQAWQAAAIDDSQEAFDARVNLRVPRWGESLRDWSMRCRSWTIESIRRGKLPMREPGEDALDRAQSDGE